MSRIARHLPRDWASRLLEQVAPLLPAGALAVELGGSQVAASAGWQAAAPAAGALPLTLAETAVGAVRWQVPGAAATATTAVATTAVAACAALCTHALQGVLDAEHARRAVGQEALENYRETALLQRAVAAFNHSLRPADVVDALLREFDGHKDAADCGAVFLGAAGGLELAQSFGEDAAAAFAALRRSALFARMENDEVGDILNGVTAADGDASAAGFTSLLWLPLRTQAERIGLLVLALRRDGSFSAADRRRAQTLAAIAASSLRNAQLYAAQQEMFEAFVRVMATAIDAKSPYTAGHCRRVPEIALMLADAAHRAESGPFAGFSLAEDERHALELAAMLHDCGKIVTPEWVTDKSTKLERVADRIETVALRFEILRLAARSACERQAAGGDAAAAQRDYAAALQRIDADWQFLLASNSGTEFMSEANRARLEEIAHTVWRDAAGNEHPLLTADEVDNLAIARGTLNAGERKIIEDHAVHTFNMLSQIPFPSGLKNVPEYAASHHERIDGTGYPRRLAGDELPLAARIVAIADIFEALTAPDRPYRKAGTLDWAIGIMHDMTRQRHIDADLFDLLLAENIHLDYARKYLSPGQLHGIDLARGTKPEPACRKY